MTRTGAAAAVAVPPGPTQRAVLGGLRHLVPVPVERHVLVAHDWRGFLAAAAALRPGMAVIDANVAGFARAGFEALRAQHPRTTLVVVVPANAWGVALGVDLLRIGADGIVAGGIQHAAEELARTLEAAIAHRVAQVALHAAGGSIPAPVRTFVERLWVHCRRPISPEEAARMYHRHQATLGRHLRAMGMPSVSRLVAWGRLFHAAYLLEEPARPVANVAAVLGFPSPSALCNQLSRYVGLTPTDLRSEGLTLVAAEFGRRGRDGEWTPRMSGTR